MVSERGCVVSWFHRFLYFFTPFIPPQNRWKHTYLSHAESRTFPGEFVVGNYSVEYVFLGLLFKDKRSVSFCYGEEWAKMFPEWEDRSQAVEKAKAYTGDNQ